MTRFSSSSTGNEPENSAAGRDEGEDDDNQSEVESNAQQESDERTKRMQECRKQVADEDDSERGKETES